METNTDQNTDIKQSSEKGQGFLSYLLLFGGFIIFLIVLAKIITWLIG